MDIVIGERYCAIVDAAHIIQVFTHRLLEIDPDITLPRSDFSGPRRSSRKVSLSLVDCLYVNDLSPRQYRFSSCPKINFSFSLTVS